MTSTDLIRLATELAECGGVHRLTNLVTAAVHVLLEHERHARAFIDALERAHRRTVEAWEDGPEVGVGMSDKVALASTPDGPAIIERYKADRDAASRAPGRDDDPFFGCISKMQRDMHRRAAGIYAPASAEVFGGISGGSEKRCPSEDAGTGLASKSVKPFCETLTNPAPQMTLNGERKPLPAMENPHAAD